MYIILLLFVFFYFKLLIAYYYQKYLVLSGIINYYILLNCIYILTSYNLNTNSNIISYYKDI